MSDAAKEAYARMLAIEAHATDRLDMATRAAIDVVKSATSFDVALSTVQAAVAPVVVEMRAIARSESTKHYAAQTGLTVSPSGTDDSERGPKAAAYYAKAWGKAIGEHAEDAWTVAVEHARLAAMPALLRVACFEVVDAWNHEHKLHALERAASPFIERWMTLADTDVCPDCKKLHGVYTNDKGEFPGAVWPPLHVMCRCFVVTEIKAAPDAAEEGKSMSAAVTIGERVELPNAPMLHRAFEVKAIDVARRTADFVASTSVIDAHDEIVDQSTWVLDDYLKNPVVLFAHQSRELPIGKSIDVQLVNGPKGMQLENRVEFCTEEMNPLAEQIWKMVQSKFLRAVSVGFIPRSYRYEMRDGVEVWVWADCVLKEISVTPVPANPEALAKMKQLALEVRTDSSIPLRSQLRASKSNTPSPSGGGIATPDTSQPKKEEFAMTEIEKAALQEQLNKSHLAIAELKLEVKNASDNAKSAEATVKALTTDKTALEAQSKTLTEDRDAQKLRADKAEGELIELEVEGIVGKTITPAEKPMFVALRKSNPDLYKDMIGQRSPLKLDKAILANDGAKDGVPGSLDPKASDDDIIAEAQKLGS